MSQSEQVGDASVPRRRLRLKVHWAVIVLTVVILFNITGFVVWSVDRETRTNPEFCSSCHIMERYVDSYLNSNRLDNVHMQANVGCKDCHVDYTLRDELESGFKFLTGDYEKVLSRRRFDDQMCLNCHISMEYQAQRTDFLTRNPHLSHWPDLRCGSCHLAHDRQVDYCSQCHDNGGQRMTGDPIVPRAHNPWAD